MWCLLLFPANAAHVSQYKESMVAQSQYYKSQSSCSVYILDFWLHLWQFSFIFLYIRLRSLELMARVEDVFLPMQQRFLTQIRRSTLEITHSRCPFICLFNSYISTLEEVRKRDLAMFAKWWQGPKGCEGMVIKHLFRITTFCLTFQLQRVTFLLKRVR